MLRSYSAPIERALILVCVFAAMCLLAADNKKEELFRQAKAAEDSEDIDTAERLYCEVAKMDAEYKDARTMCEILQQESTRVARHYEDLFNKGVAAFHQGNLDDAEQSLRNVRRGPHVAEAQQYVGKIKAARQAKAAAEAEQASAAAFDRGEQAFRRDDFSGAKAAFAQVTGKRQPEAQNYLTNIGRYEQGMAAGDQALAANNLQSALTAYRNVFAIKSDGPGDPASKFAQVSKRIEDEAQAAQRKQQEELLRAASAPPASPNKPDIRELLNEAGDARKNGDKSLAKAKYQRVLATDPKNKIAIRGLAELEGVSEGAAAANSSEALLATGLRDFYAGDYLIAEVRLQDYLNFGGKRRGLTYFFLGTCKMSRYYTSEDSDEAKKLFAEAQYNFRMAAQVPNFVPPGPKYVSPKILKAFAGSSH